MIIDEIFHYWVNYINTCYLSKCNMHLGKANFFHTYIQTNRCVIIKIQLTGLISLISCIFWNFKVPLYILKNLFQRTMKTGKNCNSTNAYSYTKIEPDNPKFLWNDNRYRRRQGENGPWTRCIRPRSYVNYSLGVRCLFTRGRDDKKGMRVMPFEVWLRMSTPLQELRIFERDQVA